MNITASILTARSGVIKDNWLSKKWLFFLVANLPFPLLSRQLLSTVAKNCVFSHSVQSWAHSAGLQEGEDAYFMLQASTMSHTL